MWHRQLGFACALAAMVGLSGAGFSGTAHAIPYETFTLNQTAIAGMPSGGAGTVTVLQLSMDQVQVSVALAPGVLLINSGGPHTPFAFNLTSAFAGVVNAGHGIAVTAPVTTAACAPAAAPCFTPTYGAGSATPYGSFNEAFTYSGSNGGKGHGNAGPLVFTITGAGIGQVTPTGSFIAFAPNSAGAVFAADLFLPVGKKGNTGSVVAFAGVAGDTGSGGPTGGGSNAGGNIPEPASLVLFGTAAAALLMVRRRQKG